MMNNIESERPQDKEYAIHSEIITEDNVRHLGEVLATCALKGAKKYYGMALDGLYRSLKGSETL